MNRLKLSVAVLAAFGMLSSASAQSTGETKTPGTAVDNQSAPATADTAKEQTPAEKKAAEKAAKEKEREEAREAKKKGKDKPESDEAKRKDTDAIGDRGVGNGVNFYSLDKEIALGKGLAQEVERQAKVVDDPIIAEYVNRIGQNLVRNSDAKVPFTIKVLDTEEVNAFALPGGFFFVNSGLILKAESEAELAGVMAHEIAHVACRHGTRQATKGDIAQIATIPLIFMGGWTGYAIRQAAGLAIPMGFLMYSRGMEAEADYFGLQYMYKAGYDPTAFVDFFEKIETLEKRKPGTVAKVFSTHPMTDDRIKKAQDEIQTVLTPRPEYVVNTSEFNDVKNRLSMLHNRRKVTNDDPNRPRLRRAPGTGTGPVDDNDGSTKTDTDERPTLKRRDSGGGGGNGNGGNFR
ncbi:MAG TPA: M48 family metallopeptidase [Bryobacteraceae bacterium]|jgi:Zn-dependent protease with chaperone function|nr:M48 family metallopeptidase [Bryobacteraceae bacterium]